jgi:hypothetical protein
LAENAELLRRELILPREDICYVSWTIDAYEGIGFLRTDDPSKGLVSLFFPSCREEEIERLLDSFEAEGIGIRRLGVYAASDSVGPNAVYEMED